MRMTNAEQYELLREMIHRQTSGAAPLRVFFTGPAGCGKTFVLRLAMDVYNRYNNSGGGGGYNAYVICASTGKAAVAVGGTTVHAAFKLSRTKLKDGGLGASELNTFRVAFRNVKCVIIDEVSMMSSDQLSAVDWRLRQITENVDQPFGGLDVILCGDLRQLPPVRASEIYKRCRNADGLFGATITWQYFQYFPLVRVVRQADRTFSDILTAIGDGRALGEDQVKLLESRFVSAEEASSLAPTAVRIFYSNHEVQRFNESDAKQGEGRSSVVPSRSRHVPRLQDASFARQSEEEGVCVVDVGVWQFAARDHSGSGQTVHADAERRRSGRTRQRCCGHATSV